MSTIAAIFRDHWGRCAPNLYKRLPRRVYNAAEEILPRLLRCKTDASGFAVLRCECGETRHVPFTCKARFCPVCGKASAAKAAEKAKDRLLNVTHRHMIFTIPHEMWGLFFEDRRLLKTLSDCAARTLLEVVDQRCRSARVLPGIMCTVQTFGRDLKFHPHVHVLVTEGGLQGTSKWQPVHHFPALSVCRKFQYHLLAELRKKFKKNRQTLALIQRAFDRYPEGFRVNVMPQYRNAAMAAAYCCRYTGRPPISESRIENYDGENVTYWYDDYRTQERCSVTVTAEEFLFRLLQHLPPKYDRTVRYYGLYARKVRRTLFAVVQTVSKYTYTVSQKIPRSLRWRERLIALFANDPHHCPRCGKEMHFVAWCGPGKGESFETFHWKSVPRKACPDQLSLCFV